MKLKILTKQKAEGYDGNSITYELLTETVEQRKAILKEMLNIKEMDPQKLKIEYLEDEEVKVDSQYGTSIVNYDFNKYSNIQFVKYKAYYDKTKISITIDFKDNYIRLKGNYTNSFNDKIIEKITEYITKDL